jgi:protein O-GlcNAc transferase
VERYALGFYRLLELPDAIAATAENYVELAVRFGKERDFRKHFGTRLIERRSQLFDDKRAVREYERFFEESVGKTQ